MNDHANDITIHGYAGEARDAEYWEREAQRNATWWRERAEAAEQRLAEAVEVLRGLVAFAASCNPPLTDTFADARAFLASVETT